MYTVFLGMNSDYFWKGTLILKILWLLQNVEEYQGSAWESADPFSHHNETLL